MKAKKSRSLTKSVSWRVIATMNTFIVLFVMTGELSFSIFASWWTTVINFILYYYHERAWNKTDWGTE